MVQTTGYQAGIETNSVQISYAVETAFAGGNTASPTPPATTFQALRIMSETLAGTKSRNRPTEINTNREAIQGVTVSEAAGGAINGALSYGTYDDLMAAVLNNDWGTSTPINEIGGDITLTNVSSTQATLSSTLSTKFQNVTAGSVIRLIGFTNSNNNGVFHVTAKADNSHLTLATPVPVTTESPSGTSASVRYGSVMNGSLFRSLFIQKKLASNLWMRYPGTYVTGFTLSGSVGGFVTINFNCSATQEASATTDASTGGIVAAPTGSVHNTVGQFYGLYWNDAPFNAIIDQFTLTVDNTGASAEYGLGSAYAQGMLTGTFTANATFRMYFRDFTYWNYFKSETAGRFSLVTRDAAGNAYAFTLPNVTLLNPTVQAGGPGAAVLASFSLEGAPQAAGGTLIIDRLPAT